MPVFEIQCDQLGEIVEIHFGGGPEPRVGVGSPSDVVAGSDIMIRVPATANP